MLVANGLYLVTALSYYGVPYLGLEAVVAPFPAVISLLGDYWKLDVTTADEADAASPFGTSLDYFSILTGERASIG